MSDETKTDDGQDDEISLEQALAAGLDDVGADGGMSDGGTPAETPDGAAEEILAPDHWSQEDKDAFTALPAEARRPYLDRATVYDQRHSERMDAVAAREKALEAYQGFGQLFTPQDVEQLSRMGTDPLGYVRSLIQTHYQLQQDPQGTLFRLAQQMGVKFGEPGSTEEDDLDPAVAGRFGKLEQQLDKLNSAFTQSRQSLETASNAQVQDAWRAFASAKDDQGTPLYPNAEGLKVKIGLALQTLESVPGETAADLLKRAYEEVKWTDPDLRQSILAEEAKAKQAAAEAKRKAEVEKAKRAGRNIKSESGPVSEESPEGETIKDALEREYDRLSAA